MPQKSATLAGSCLLFSIAVSALVAALALRGLRPGQTGSAVPTSARNRSSNTTAEPTLAPPAETRADALARLARSSQPGDPQWIAQLEALASDHPHAVSDALRLMADFPERAEEICTVLVGALIRSSDFSSALDLARQAPEACRTRLLTLVLSDWARTRPEDARLIADQLRDNGIGEETYSVITRNWASSAPEQLGRYASALPAGSYRTIAIKSVVEPWILQDPAAVADWLPQLGDPGEHDLVLAKLVACTDRLFRPTSQALAWAESIREPKLQAEALSAVLCEWSIEDKDGATRYVESCSTFDPQKRQSLIAALSPRTEPQ